MNVVEVRAIREQTAPYYTKLPMKIPDLSQLPAGAGQAEWARQLSCDVSTVRRAIVRGDLAVTDRRGRPFITRRSILAWLGMSDEIVVESPTFAVYARRAKLTALHELHFQR